MQVLPTSWGLCSDTCRPLARGQHVGAARVIHIQEGLPLSDLNRRGLLLVMGEPHPDAEAEFNRWYDEEHLKERIACPGILGARRFRAVEGTPRYLALYELELAPGSQNSAVFARDQQ